MNNRRKSIFITGAASGIGRATALYFADLGWFIGLSDINRDSLDPLASEIGNGNCFSAQLDVSDRDAYRAVLTNFSEKTDGYLDILFNNAGTGTGKLFSEEEFSGIERTVQVNIMGVMIGIHSAYPMLKRTPGALCFSTSSSSAIIGVAGLATYSATKHAVKGLTEALSIEFMPDDIRAADTLPGQIDTAMLVPEMRENAPEKGMWRIMPAKAVAEAVWSSYNDKSGKLHWYVPEELEKLETFVTTNPESVRDTSADFFFTQTKKKVLDKEK